MQPTGWGHLSAMGGARRQCSWDRDRGDRCFDLAQAQADDGTRMKKLETYVEEERRNGGRYQHSALHLSARLSMTEAQVLEAAIASAKVEKVLGEDEQGFANRVLFQYTTGSAEKDLELDGLAPRRSRRRVVSK